ncbi:hypothetical protein ACJX0J_040338, partial [Zea mays]
MPPTVAVIEKSRMQQRALRLRWLWQEWNETEESSTALIMICYNSKFTLLINIFIIINLSQFMFMLYVMAADSNAVLFTKDVLGLYVTVDNLCAAFLINLLSFPSGNPILKYQRFFLSFFHFPGFRRAGKILFFLIQTQGLKPCYRIFKALPFFVYLVFISVLGRELYIIYVFKYDLLSLTTSGGKFTLLSCIIVINPEILQNAAITTLVHHG